MGDRVTALPGLNLQHIVYSGYLRVPRPDGASVANLFYVYIEKDGGDADGSAPLLVWGQGGPGCSSMLGLFTEFGPWKPLEGGNLGSNPYSWSSEASLLFIDSPAGAGFSYSGGVARREDDASSARDYLGALSLFFARYPDKRRAPFYFASESYGGHFLIQWVDLVLNSPTFSHLTVNFAGALLGNPFVSWESSDLAYAHTLWGRQLVAAPLWRLFVSQQCDLFNAYTATTYPAKCEALLAQVVTQMNSASSIAANLNAYDLIDPVCSGSSTQSRRLLQLSRYISTHHHRILDFSAVDVNSHSDPCIELWLVAYLSRPEVRLALHVDKDAAQWIQCSDDLFYNWPSADLHADTTRIIRKILAQESIRTRRFLVFSGDADGVCPTIGTMHWIWRVAESSQRRQIDIWSQWLDSSNQTGGMVSKFDSQFSFATVHSAGHMVAQTQPIKALSLVTAFLAGSANLFANSSTFQVQQATLQSSQTPQDPSESALVAALVVVLTVGALVSFVAVMQRQSR